MVENAVLPGDPILEKALRRDIEGEILFGRADRGRYSTDASIYQVEPLGVVIPKTRDDLQAALTIARERGVPILARGGGTSQCGQTVNRAIVLDCSKYLRKVLAIDVEARTALVEPGIVLQHLNAELKPHGLFFPVDPSTHQRCTIGGMAGNNSCGSKSIRYGLMADNVEAIDALLADGTRHRFGPPATRTNAAMTDLFARLRLLGATEAEEIAARFPRQLRRVGGYNIDALTPGARMAGRDNLARLLIGSEGTLAISEALLLKLVPIKPRKVVGICQFPTFRAAMEATKHLVALDPEAVELVDRTMIDLGRGITIYKHIIDRMLIGEPDSLLLVEFHGDDDAWLASRLRALDEAMGDLGYPGAVVHASDVAFQGEIAEVREAGLNIMMSMKSAGKPISFIEDCAVDLADLADYTESLNDVFAKHGTKGTWYAHASVGCLHVRPVLDMKKRDDVATMRKVAEECFDLVRAYKGSHSGEHGDGIARSEFNEPMFGARIARAFEAVKDAFDPRATLNPNRITRPPNFDDRRLFRYAPGIYQPEAIVPRLDWSAWPGVQGGLLAAVEMCNNNGTCRKFDAGAMCPSYRITRDETHLTRGRANTLRLALTGQLGPDALAGPDVAEALKLCVSCKACRRECPTGVDMAKMKIEASAARAARHGVSMRDRLVAEMPRYAPWASRFAPLANLRNRSPMLRRLMQGQVGIAASRPLPAFQRDVFRDAEIGAPTGASNEVILFADTFNRYYEPENLRAAIRVLRGHGLVPVAPRATARPLCCGRTYLSAGLVDKARVEARRTLDALSGDQPVIGLEPSCLMTLRDEFGSMLPGAETEALAKRARLLTEYLVESKSTASLSLSGTAHVHGHCHQKSFGAFPAQLSALNAIEGLDVRPIQSSCCGMAGAFGYQSETQEASLAMAEASLLPAVRAAGVGDFIVADGTSCRHQIADLSGRIALHSVRVLDQAMRP